MKIKMILIIPLLVLPASDYLAADPVDTHVIEARGIVNQFFGSLVFVN